MGAFSYALVCTPQSIIITEDKNMRRAERTERAEAAKRTERAKKPERIERTKRTERAKKPERIERTERAEKPERIERKKRSVREKRPVGAKRTVAQLLGLEMKGMRNRLLYGSLPRHTFIYCRSRNIANRFLADAESEGFTFGDGAKPTNKEYSDLYSLHDDFTISYTGWSGHVLFRNAAGNIVRIDYGRYIVGAADYRI